MFKKIRFQMIANRQELVTAEMARGHRLDNLFDLGSDDVLVAEVRVFENPCEDALGEQVLDEHLLNRFRRKIRIDRLTAQLVKAVEAGTERFVALALGFD
jgi:hypothetical protein